MELYTFQKKYVLVTFELFIRTIKFQRNQDFRSAVDLAEQGVTVFYDMRRYVFVLDMNTETYRANCTHRRNVQHFSMLNKTVIEQSSVVHVSVAF